MLISLYCIHRNLLSLVKISNFLSCVKDCVEDNYGNLHCIGKNIFREIFLQYKGTWAWQNFYPAKIFTYMVLEKTGVLHTHTGLARYICLTVLKLDSFDSELWLNITISIANQVQYKWKFLLDRNLTKPAFFVKKFLPTPVKAGAEHFYIIMWYCYMDSWYNTCTSTL